jgi:hypothetical protein
LQKNTSEATEHNEIIAGARNLCSSASYFCELNVPIVDISTPGCTATSASITKLCGELESKITVGTSRVIFDLLRNTSLHYKHNDWTISLPYKSRGRFHFEGKTVVTPTVCIFKVFDT